MPFVRGGQRVGEGRSDLEEPFDREPAFRQDAIERLPLDELHGEEVNSSVGREPSTRRCSTEKTVTMPG